MDCPEKEIFLSKYGNLFSEEIQLFDVWASIYNNPPLFWNSLFARYYAKELFDIATEYDKYGEDSYEAWLHADNVEMFAKCLEDALIVQEANVRYSYPTQISEEY
jgi:hypothetical protein